MKVSLSFLAFFFFNAVVTQAQKLDHLMDSVIKQRNFNGVVLIAKNGKTDYLRYTGIANRHSNTMFSKDTRFHIFSVTKTFTAVLILQLAEQKRISLDSTISAYYPEYKGEAAHKVTIRNLLSYSSGRDLKEMRDLLEAYSTDIWGVDTFINKYCSEKLIDTPGTKFKYSNGDFIILGRIIEKIYGQPFEEVLRSQILSPLKMTNTDYLHHSDIIKGLDEAYTFQIGNESKLEMTTNYYIDNFYSAGAMYSTAEDLLRFDQAIFNHKILKKETVELMLTPIPGLDDTALGFWVYPKKFGSVNTILAERQGYGFGNSSNWVHLVDKGVTVILMSNTNAADLNKLRMELIKAYLKQ